ncbi:hypothetical protein [Mesorhizobium sp.]|uniref:hypothetical protein n=1 Tax=Mesorhizobium sp. TaxID=1871066 RepID=UPI0025DB2B12|nr:hypothetical protein [Mesorhizobium sp.]
MRHQQTTAFRLKIDDQRLLDFRTDRFYKLFLCGRMPANSSTGSAKPGAGLLDRHDHIAAVARAERNAIGPTGGNPVSTIVCTKLPDEDVPECAQQSRAADLSDRRRCGLAPSGELRTHSCPAALAAASVDADPAAPNPPTTR